MTWIEIVGPTSLVIIGGVVSWLLQNRIQKLNKLNEELRQQRIKKYASIVDPIVVIYSKVDGGPEKAGEILQSIEYRRASFELNFWGSDEVVNAYNDLIQFMYSRDREGYKASDTYDMLRLLGTLFLEIRKDVGNSRSKLQPIDMLRSMITDIDQYRNGFSP